MKLIISLTYLVISLNILSLGKPCKNTHVTIVTKDIIKKRSFLFIGNPYDYNIHIEQIINANNTIIMEGKTDYIQRGSVYKTVQFNRFKIKNDSIILYQFKRSKEFGYKTFYDLCGNQLKKEKIPVQLILEKFLF